MVEPYILILENMTTSSTDFSANQEYADSAAFRILKNNKVKGDHHTNNLFLNSALINNMLIQLNEGVFKRI